MRRSHIKPGTMGMALLELGAFDMRLKPTPQAGLAISCALADRGSLTDLRVACRPPSVNGLNRWQRLGETVRVPFEHVH
jgi:hypothetical protein